MPRRGRPRSISKEPNTTKLFTDDRRELIALSSNEKKSMSMVIRELVHEALRERRLRSIGRDERKDFGSGIDLESITEVINPLVTEIAILRQKIETLSGNPVWEQRSSEILPSATEQATLAIVRMLFGRTMVTENLGKILVTVGMQKDNIKEDEIQKLLSNQEQNGHRQAEAIAQKVLSQFHLPDANETGAKDRGGVR